MVVQLIGRTLPEDGQKFLDAVGILRCVWHRRKCAVHAQSALASEIANGLPELKGIALPRCVVPQSTLWFVDIV